MNSIIGVILDKEKTMTSINNADSFCLYEKEADAWVIAHEFVLPATSMTSIVQTREYTKNLCNLLGDCKILVGTEILGLPFHLLDAKGFLLCEAKQLNDELLDAITNDYLNQQMEAGTSNEEIPVKDIPVTTPTAPVPTDLSGNYYLDLDLALKSHPSLTSKKILLPFFEKTLFDTLTIDCNHIMPWLDTMLPSCLSYRSDSSEDGRKRIEIIANS